MINLTIHRQTKQNLYRNDPSFRKHSCPLITQKPLDTLRFGATPIRSKQSNGIKRLFDSPGKNFAWSVGYGILGALALPVPPLAIGLFSIAGIHLITSLIQVIAHKPKAKVDAQPKTTNTISNEKQNHQIDNTVKDTDPPPSITLSPEQQREKLVFDRLPNHFKERLRLYKANPAYSSRVYEFTESFGKLIQTLPPNATTYADYTEKNKSDVKIFTYRLLNDPERLFVDIGRLLADRLGMDPVKIENIVYKSDFYKKHEDEDLNVTMNSNGRTCTLKALFEPQGIVSLNDSNRVLKATLGRSNLPDSVEYILSEGGKTLAEMSLRKNSYENPFLEIQNYRYNANSQEFSKEAAIFMLRLALEEAYTQDCPILKCRSTVIPSEVLNKHNFNSAENANYFLAGEQFYKTLDLLPKPPVTKQAKQAFKKGYLT